MSRSSVQPYPRRKDGFLDDVTLVPHRKKPSSTKLRKTILEAIAYANEKSSREILKIEQGLSAAEVQARYRSEGKKLFDYFLRYCSDPASMAHQVRGRHYKEVAAEQFRNRTLQKERMNSGWRYQYIAKAIANFTKRFSSGSDLGAAEADFNVTVDFSHRPGHLTIYVSVKNRVNTMGGQDWPKAISALEAMAVNDRNRSGPYLCVFGIAMERGGRMVKREGRTGRPYSVNTEVWKSTYFWPFFTNCSYEEISTAVLDVLIEQFGATVPTGSIPESLIESFGDCCRRVALIDASGCFNDPFKLVRLICGSNA